MTPFLIDFKSFIESLDFHHPWQNDGQNPEIPSFPPTSFYEGFYVTFLPGKNYEKPTRDSQILWSSSPLALPPCLFGTLYHDELSYQPKITKACEGICMEGIASQAKGGLLYQI